MTDATDAAGTSAQDGLPSWAVVSPVRAAHVRRVVALLDQWAAALSLPATDARRWATAGWLHDALRDADEAQLRHWSAMPADPIALLHGPAAAARAAHEGEDDAEVLAAVRWHTTGAPTWGAIGDALYAADFLEPGRDFAQAERATLAAAYPADPRGVLREVVTLRMAHHRRKGRTDHPLTLRFLESLSG